MSSYVDGIEVKVTAFDKSKEELKGWNIPEITVERMFEEYYPQVCFSYNVNTIKEECEDIIRTHKKRTYSAMKTQIAKDTYIYVDGMKAPYETGAKQDGYYINYCINDEDGMLDVSSYSIKEEDKNTGEVLFETEVDNKPNIVHDLYAYLDEYYAKYGKPTNIIDDETKTLIKGDENTIIPNDGSVEIIGRSAFEECEELTSIIISDGVKKICARAFEGCKNLKEVVISDSVEEIEFASFRFCSSLEKVVLPEKLRALESQTFLLCSKLKEITIPKNVEYIAPDAINNNDVLETINVDKDNKTFISKNNCLIDVKNKTLIKGTKNSIIPDDGSVTCIGKDAFCDVNIYNITIPNTIIEIADHAFRTKTLESLVIPKSVKRISAWCSYDNTKMYYEGSLEDWMKVEKCVDNIIFNDKFFIIIDGKETIETIVIPNSFSEITPNMLFCIKGIKKIIIEDGVSSICNSGFANCRDLETIVIPESVTKIEGKAFSLCFNLKEVIIPNGITNIEYETFKCCKNLVSITLPDTIQQIQDFSFEGCEELLSITIPKGIQKIGWRAFTGCKKLDVNYKGTKKDWENIDIEDCFDNNITIHCVDGDLVLKSKDDPYADCYGSDEDGENNLPF